MCNLFPPSVLVLHEEEPCMQLGCKCYFDSRYEENVFNCQNRELTAIPEKLEPGSQWVNLKFNNITGISGHLNQFENVLQIELAHNNIGFIGSESMAQLISMEYIDLSHNNLSSLPKTIEKAPNSSLLKIGNNPYKCDCDILWMTNWLLHAKRGHVDFYDTKCGYGSKVGTPIFELT